MRRFLLLLSVLALTGCSASFQAQQGNSRGSQVAQAANDTASHKTITSTKGYNPTSEDVTRYNNDVEAFLKANVPGFGKQGSVLIMVDDKKAESLKSVALSNVKNISVLDSSNAAILGSSDYKSAIIIKTK